MSIYLCIPKEKCFTHPFVVCNWIGRDSTSWGLAAALHKLCQPGEDDSAAGELPKASTCANYLTTPVLGQ